jgi:hypothetical protein
LRERFAFEAESTCSNLIKHYRNNLRSRVPDMIREFEVGDRVQQRSLLTEQQATGYQGQECLTAYTHRSESQFRNPHSCTALTKARRALDSNRADKPQRANAFSTHTRYLNARRLANRSMCEAEGQATCAHALRFWNLAWCSMIDSF